MVITGVPPAEVAVDPDLVRSLLERQHPDFAELPLRFAASGWDNITYRLGEKLAVRLPRITTAATLIRHEQRWLPVLAAELGLAELPVAVPAPVRLGTPGEGYPWPWSIVPWVPGQSCDREPLVGSQAGTLGRFLRALHRPAPVGYPRNDYRGVPLATRDEEVRSRIDELLGTDDHGVDVPVGAVRGRWRESVAAPLDTPPVRIHGDLHPKNLVVAQGRLAAVIDWGDTTVGDPATDLAAAWMLFPPEHHRAVRDGYGMISEATAVRARGWALLFGLLLLASGLDDDPALADIGRLTLRRACSA